MMIAILSLFCGIFSSKAVRLMVLGGAESTFIGR